MRDLRGSVDETKEQTFIWICSPGSFGGSPHLHPLTSQTVSSSSSVLMSHTFIPVAPSSPATEACGNFPSTLFPLPASQQKALCLPKGLTTPWPEPEKKGPPFPCLSTWATSELFPCYFLLERMSNIFMAYFSFQAGRRKMNMSSRDTLPAPLATTVDHMGSDIS